MRLTQEEMISIFKTKFIEYWDLYWKETTNLSGKGLFLINIRSHIKDKVNLNTKYRKE